MGNLFNFFFIYNFHRFYQKLKKKYYIITKQLFIYVSFSIFEIILTYKDLNLQLIISQYFIKSVKYFVIKKLHQKFKKQTNESISILVSLLLSRLKIKKSNKYVQVTRKFSSLLWFWTFYWDVFLPFYIIHTCKQINK